MATLVALVDVAAEHASPTHGHGAQRPVLIAGERLAVPIEKRFTAASKHIGYFEPMRHGYSAVASESRSSGLFVLRIVACDTCV